MSQLWDIVQRIDRVIERKQLPLFLTKGKIAIRAGFALGIIDPQTRDEAHRISQLRTAAREVLGEDV